jgi:hypothetical protein
MGTNNNGWLPMKIVEMLVERMEVDVKHSLERVSNEISEALSDKLDLIGHKIDKMILVVRVVFAILAVSVLLAVFGSHMLYKYNASTLIKETIKKESKENITRSELKGIISEYLKELDEKKK